MKRFPIHAATILLIVAVGLSGALAASVNTYIKQLKDKDPKVRAEAALELCGG